MRCRIRAVSLFSGGRLYFPFVLMRRPTTPFTGFFFYFSHTEHFYRSNLLPE